ncbi:alpha/beta hydrolase family protein [Dyadobacter frigoris]|uniref:Alpha/beta fold hydrolase n=1 Tax=Dyadobacter frigoris TaxID=2576211 RepID=A0A4U6DAU9_9BACT|nr:alpha/beta hydrolase [Dyadobacter frigoris]TKT93976.1 alpha/beta fold hydrolase [Dyadobacter frigoris]GLU50805.1 alpha/beta hydrolase [Dyadobacter frigoris]
MKNTLLFTFLILIFLNCSAQDISGQWTGILKVPGAQLGLVLYVTKTNEGYSATLDSPNQGAKGIPVNSVEFNSSVLKLTMTSLNAEYSGTLGADNIFKGIFKQNGQSFPLDLGRGDLEKPKLSRPQEPVKPYPYYSEDVKFENQKDKITLAGTLTLPAKEGNFPVVVLISGSGPQDRNEELLGHKPFLVLSDYLTRNGIAVLRYDDRGTAQSTGVFGIATTKDFATDVESAVSYLKTRREINQEKIGLIGHSEGGMIAPMVAAGSDEIAFIVLLAGPGIAGDELLIKQAHLIFRANGVSESVLDEIDVLNKKGYTILKDKSDLAEIKKELLPIMDETFKLLPATQQPPADKRNEYLMQSVNQIATPWYQFFLRYDPAETLEKVKCPVLALNGSNDLQVPPKEDLEGIRMALEKGENKNFKIKELPKLNHLFQESETGSPGDYAKIEQTFSPTALTEISEWIKLIVLK